MFKKNPGLSHCLHFVCTACTHTHFIFVTPQAFSSEKIQSQAMARLACFHLLQGKTMQHKWQRHIISGRARCRSCTLWKRKTMMHLHKPLQLLASLWSQSLRPASQASKYASKFHRCRKYPAGCIKAWYGNSNAQEHKMLRKVVESALPTTNSIYLR